MEFFLDNLDACSTSRIHASISCLSSTLMASINARNHTVRALVHIADEPVQDTTAQSSSSILLAGVPIVVKDLIDVADMPTRLGSRAVSDVPSAHAQVVSRLIREGALIVGKSHTTEFAMSGWGISALGRPLNPIDARDLFFTGGSSNGSASAVASGLVPAALGTDTGGSIRIPSSWCGITGLKGSTGWVSTKGVAPLSQRHDVVGPMARTVKDVMQLYRAMLPMSRRSTLEMSLESLKTKPHPTLVFLDDCWLGDVDHDVLAAYRLAEQHCNQLGFRTVRHPLPCSFEEMAEIWSDISALEGYLNNRKWADDPTAPLEDSTRDNLLKGQRIDFPRYFTLLNSSSQRRELMEQILQPGQLLVTPTTSTPAMPLPEIDARRTLGIYTRFVNLIQGCAVALPNGITPDGRPISMQFVGAYGEDAVVLHAAAIWQTYTDWHERICLLHQQQMQKLSTP